MELPVVRAHEGEALFSGGWIAFPPRAESS